MGLLHHIDCKCLLYVVPNLRRRRRDFILLALREKIARLGFHVIGPFGRVADAIAAVGREDFHSAVLDVNLQVRPRCENACTPRATRLRSRKYQSVAPT